MMDPSTRHVLNLFLVCVYTWPCAFVYAAWTYTPLNISMSAVVIVSMILIIVPFLLLVFVVLYYSHLKTIFSLKN